MSLEGQQIDRYHIVRLLGSGGMGDVYLAEDPRIEQQVAIKVMRAEASPYPDASATQEATRLFQREAKAIAKLDHPRILPMYGYGEQRIGNTTLIYLVMPYRPEGSLADWLRQRGQAGLLSPQEVAHFVHQAASALQHAHNRQIIHQDVKPSNFLIHSSEEDAKHPDVLLADFGVAKFTSATASMSHTIRGTPTYMAPEQWSGEPVPATDQYALAVMAYELLTGHLPFQGPPMQVMYQHVHTPPPLPSTFKPQLSRDIDTVLLHALAKKPEERFASIIAFANAFQQAAQGVQKAPAPTRLAPAPALHRGSDLRAVLAISTTEAQTGSSRTLNLPGGRKVTVPVPAGIQDGQIVRLDGQGEPASVGDEAGALILTIRVEAVEARLPPFASQVAAAEPTVFVGNMAGSETSTPTARSTSHQPTENLDGLQHTVGRVTCPFCATENAPEEAFCVSCGFALYEISKLGGAAIPRQSKKKKALSEPVQPTAQNEPSGQSRKAEEGWLQMVSEEQARLAKAYLKATEEQARLTEEERLARVFANQEEERLQSTPPPVYVPAPSASPQNSQLVERRLPNPAGYVPAPSASPQNSQRRREASGAVVGWTSFAAFAVFVGTVAWWVFYVFLPYHGNSGAIWGGLVGIFFQGLGIAMVGVYLVEPESPGKTTRGMLVGIVMFLLPIAIVLFNHFHA